jgi:predicted ATPase
VSQAIIRQDNGQWRLSTELSPLTIPHTVRQLIERQVERLREEEQQVLEGASVAGTEFTVAAMAAALKEELDIIEDVCEGIAWQGHFLEEKGIAEWPDGTVSGRYGFRHALYQNVLYDRIAEARRVRLHRAIGERTEAGYEAQAQEIAAELAVHFEQGHDYPAPSSI